MPQALSIALCVCLPGPKTGKKALSHLLNPEEKCPQPSLVPHTQEENRGSEKRKEHPKPPQRGAARQGAELYPPKPPPAPIPLGGPGEGAAFGLPDPQSPVTTAGRVSLAKQLRGQALREDFLYAQLRESGACQGSWAFSTKKHRTRYTERLPG